MFFLQRNGIYELFKKSWNVTYFLQIIFYRDFYIRINFEIKRG